jgi:hypothetical protein
MVAKSNDHLPSTPPPTTPKRGEYLNHDTTQPRPLGMYSNRGYGHVLNLVVVRVVDVGVLGYGRVGESLKVKRVIMQQHDDALAVPSMLIK